MDLNCRHHLDSETIARDLKNSMLVVRGQVRSETGDRQWNQGGKRKGESKYGK